MRLKIILFISIPAFFAMSILGNHGPTLMANGKCFRFFGCNSGFFGYDAAVHFVSGIAVASLIIWLMRKFPAISPFRKSVSKNILIVVTLALLVAFAWELGELCHDQFRMKVLRENLTIPNTLDQPTNDDTMGDITFSVLGALLATTALRSYLYFI